MMLDRPDPLPFYERVWLRQTSITPPYIANSGKGLRMIVLVFLIVSINTSAKIIQLNEWRCRDGMHCAKNRGNKEIPLVILSRILAQPCVTPPYI